jgi:hypothetical protein
MSVYDFSSSSVLDYLALILLLTAIAYIFILKPDSHGPLATLCMENRISPTAAWRLIVVPPPRERAPKEVVEGIGGKAGLPSGRIPSGRGPEKALKSDSLTVCVDIA